MSPLLPFRSTAAISLLLHGDGAFTQQEQRQLREAVALLPHVATSDLFADRVVIVFDHPTDGPEFFVLHRGCGHLEHFADDELPAYFQCCGPCVTGKDTSRGFLHVLVDMVWSAVVLHGEGEHNGRAVRKTTELTYGQLPRATK